jgi:hypothetical protein
MREPDAGVDRHSPEHIITASNHIKKSFRPVTENLNNDHDLHVYKHRRTERCIFSNESVRQCVVRPTVEKTISSRQTLSVLRQVYVGQCPLSDVGCPKYPVPF